MTFTILGAGIAGLGCSYYLGHENCNIFEKNSYHGDHIATHHHDDCQWVEGPHISFTKHESIRDLLTISANCNVLEFQASVGNWFQGCWIPHPAQTNLYAAPQDIRKRCLEDFLVSREQKQSYSSQNYGQWLQQAFDATFAETFLSQYARKYWTFESVHLGTDWIGERVYYANVDTVKSGWHGWPY